jgi:uncharacterized protein (TIGR02145 family)
LRFFTFGNISLFSNNNEGAVMKRLVAVAQLALCFVLVSCNSGSGQTRPSELVGHWVHGSGGISGTPDKMELFKDGTGVADKVSISWKVEGKRLVILSSLMGMSYNYKVSGYELTLIDDDGDSEIFVRKGKLEEFKAKLEAEKAKRIAEAKRAFEQLPRFTDSRDNKVYRTVTIGGKTWMAENLNFAAEGSKCYRNNAEYCEKYGRLYNWTTALKACPAGYHLPSDGEWTMLENAVGGKDIAGTKLKSTDGWDEDGNGTNDFGFSALPGGLGGADNYFSDAGSDGYWWSATEINAYNAWIRDMYSYVRDSKYFRKGNLFSVRCVQDKSHIEQQAEQAIERGNKALDNGKFDEAIAGFNEAIKLNPNSDIYFKRGNAYYDKKDYDKAVADYTETIRLNPKADGAYNNRGNVYLYKKDYDKAIADYTETIRLNPKADRAYINRGDAYHDKKDYDKAIADYTEAIRLNPKADDAYANRGKTYLFKEDDDKAIADFNQAILLNPNNATANLFKPRNLDDEIAEYTEAIRLNPKDVDAYIDRGSTYFEKKDYDRAIQDYSQAIRLDPENDNAPYLMRGRLYAHKGDFDKAIADANKVIRLDPENWDAYHCRGSAYLGKKDYDKAIADFEKAIADFEESLRRSSMSGKMSFEEAKKDLEKAKKLKGGR